MPLPNYDNKLIPQKLINSWNKKTKKLKLPQKIDLFHNFYLFRLSLVCLFYFLRFEASCNQLLNYSIHIAHSMTSHIEFRINLDHLQLKYQFYRSTLQLLFRQCSLSVEWCRKFSSDEVDVKLLMFLLTVLLAKLLEQQLWLYQMHPRISMNKIYLLLDSILKVKKNIFLWLIFDWSVIRNPKNASMANPAINLKES